MKKITFPTMLLFMVLSIWGCSREAFEPEQCDSTPEDSRTESIRNARTWFERQQASLRSAHMEMLYDEPTWRFTDVRRKDSLVVVETDLTDACRYDFLTEETHQLMKQDTTDWQRYHSVTRMVILRNTITGEQKGLLMTLLPSQKYLKQHAKNLMRNNYLRKESNFEGTVLFHALDGTPLYGEVYQGGLMKKHLKPHRGVALGEKGYTLTTTLFPGRYTVAHGTMRKADNTDGGDEDDYTMDGGELDEVTVVGHRPDNWKERWNSWEDFIEWVRNHSTGWGGNEEVVDYEEDPNKETTSPSGNEGGGGGNEKDPKVIKEDDFATSRYDCIYQKLRTTSDFVRKIHHAFDKEGAVCDLVLGIEDLTGQDIYAKTIPPGAETPYQIRIVFDSQLLDKCSNILHASTIIHELAHAQMFLYLMSCSTIDKGVIQAYLNEHNYPGLFDYYTRYAKNSQHELMAAHYVDIFVEILQEFNPSCPDNICRALAWEGLQGTTAWNQHHFSEDEKTEMNLLVKLEKANKEKCE